MEAQVAPGMLKHFCHGQWCCNYNFFRYVTSLLHANAKKGGSASLHFGRKHNIIFCQIPSYLCTRLEHAYNTLKNMRAQTACEEWTCPGIKGRFFTLPLLDVASNLVYRIKLRFLLRNKLKGQATNRDVKYKKQLLLLTYNYPLALEPLN